MTVIDTGIGIAAEQLPNLFQPFHQLDSQLNRRYEGTGLGLVLTQRLAQLHGGDVTVASVLGQGSRFTISLADLSQQPMVSGDTAQLLALSAVAEPLLPHLEQASLHDFSATGRQKRIAIVEDNLNSAVLLQNYLQISGYRVQYLRSGNNFLDRLRSFQPDLILIDTQLAGQGTGIALLIALRQQPDLQQLPVIVMTATAIQGDRDLYLAAGATDYLTKPIGLMQIESLLMRFL
jgi:CheY-like chemotaxis protein